MGAAVRRRTGGAQPSGGIVQSTGSRPASTRAAFARLNGRDPKNPREADSGEDSVRLAQELNPDVILMDVNMPGIGGVKCLRQIMSLSPEAKVIIISGYLSNGRVEEAMTLGAKACLTKPFRFKELLTTVRNVLEKDLK